MSCYPLPPLLLPVTPPFVTRYPPQFLYIFIQVIWFWYKLEEAIYKTSSFNWFIFIFPLPSSHNICLCSIVVVFSFGYIVPFCTFLLLPAILLEFLFCFAFSHSFSISLKGLKFQSFRLILSMSFAVSGLILATP